MVFLKSVIMTWYGLLLNNKSNRLRENMKTVGSVLGEFKVTGVNPDNTFFDIDSSSFLGNWKVIVFYPKDFTFVCPTEIVAYDALHEEFEARGATLLIGSTDNEFCKVAWKESDPQLKNLKSIMFADTRRGSWDGSLSEDLGVFSYTEGAALRATFIVDPNNIIQHASVNNLNVGRNADETLRLLDALQTGEKTACSRPIGGATL